MIYNKSCYGLSDLEPHSIDALITDPPYGIAFQNQEWDRPKEYEQNSKKSCPHPAIWKDSFNVMRPGAYGLVFSFPRVMHRIMADLEDSGFIIKDVLMWVYLNGMPKTQNIGLSLDKLQGIESEVVGEYSYVMGYVPNGSETYKATKKKYKLKPISELGKKYDGAGINLKPCYEPIILIQKPIEKGLSIAQNIQKYGTGVLNLEAVRIPYEKGEKKVGHNPHPHGRVHANLLRTYLSDDDYNKYFFYGDKNFFCDSDESIIYTDDFISNKAFFYPKVRQNKENFNIHPTLKPVELMKHLIKLVTFEEHTILDPFMGSGTTGVACNDIQRNFVGYELESKYYNIAKERLKNNILHLPIK